MAKRNDLSTGTYITDPFGTYPPTLAADQPLGTGQEYRVPVGTYAATALPAPRTASTPKVIVTQHPNPLGGTNPSVAVEVPLPGVVKPRDSTAQTVGDVAQSTPAEQSNIDLIREAMTGGEPGYNNLSQGRFSQGPKGFLQNSFSPGGNSWMWFTGGSPFPVQETPQIIDASTEVLRNINAAIEYQRKKKRYDEEQARRDAQQRGQGTGGQAPGSGPALVPIPTSVYPQGSAPTIPSDWGNMSTQAPQLGPVQNDNPFRYARSAGPGF